MKTKAPRLFRGAEQHRDSIPNRAAHLVAGAHRDVANVLALPRRVGGRKQEIAQLAPASVAAADLIRAISRGICFRHTVPLLHCMDGRSGPRMT